LPLDTSGSEREPKLWPNTHFRRQPNGGGQYRGGLNYWARSHHSLCANLPSTPPHCSAMPLSWHASTRKGPPAPAVHEELSQSAMNPTTHLGARPGDAGAQRQPCGSISRPISRGGSSHAIWPRANANATRPGARYGFGLRTVQGLHSDSRTSAHFPRIMHTGGRRQPGGQQSAEWSGPGSTRSGLTARLALMCAQRLT
jgi:hypothetical protein